MRVFAPRFLWNIWPSTLLGALVTTLSVALPLPVHGTILGLPSPCPFFHLTGIPCPGCGLTRSFVCCGHGRIAEAFQWHPLGPPLFAATVVYTLITLTSRSKIDLTPLMGTRALLAITAIMFAFWVLRLGGVFPMPGT